MKTSVLHIGKTAGTALFAALKEANQDNNLVLHGHAMTLDALWEKFPNRSVVFGVREPIARYVSAFNSRLREGLPRHHTPWSKSEQVAFSLFKTPNELAEALSSTNVMERSAAQLSMLSIRHVSKPLSHYLDNVEKLQKNRKKIKFVYLTETLNSDFEVMKEMLELGDISLPTEETAAHKMPPGMSVHLSEKGRKNLEEWFREDRELYSFCKELRSHYLDEIGSKKSAN